MAEAGKILWPARSAPENCPVDIRNQIEIPSEPTVVWTWLIRAQLWPTWYPNSANMRFTAGQPPDLALATRFK